MTARYLTFTLTLHAPAILNMLGGDPNSAATLGFIPGAAVRGAVAARLGDPDFRPEIRPRFQDYVLNGNVRYLPAYPLDDARMRTVPAPISLRSSTQGDEHFDLAAFEGQDQATWPEDSLSSFRWHFLSLTSAQPAGIVAGIGSRIHHQRDRRLGRAWTDKRDGREIQHGALYGYEYLEPEQAFGGFIQVRGLAEEEFQRCIDELRTLLQNRIHVGRSRRAGYGGEAGIEWGRVQEREITGENVISHNIAAGEQFRILLTSDCIVRSPRTGQIDPGALPELVLERLGSRARLVRVRWSFEIIGGFNRKWRLELPQARGVAAGSVLLFEAEQQIPIADLLAIEHDGIGERLTEGYGRIVFLESPVARLRVRTPSLLPISRPSTPVPELVRLLEGRLLKAAAQQEIERVALAVAARANGIPSGSLIGRLRVPLRGDSSAALETVSTWISAGDHALRRPARDQLVRCRITLGGTSQSLLTWIRNLSGAGRWAHLQDILRLAVLTQRNHLDSEKSALAQCQQICDDLAVRLIDSALAGLAKERKRRETGLR